MTEECPSNIFLKYCKDHGVKKPNPEVVKLLREGTEIIDLSDNYLGNRGLLAMLDTLQHIPNCKSINLKGQKIYNTDLSPSSVKGNTMLDRLMEVAAVHPSLRVIDLSDNPLSNLAGRKLLELASKKDIITELGVSDTYIDGDLCKQIQQACKGNMEKNPPQPEIEPPEDEPAFGEVKWSGRKSVTADEQLGMQTMGMTKVRRKTVKGNSYDIEEVKRYLPPVYDKSPEDANNLREFLKGNLLFSHLERQAVDDCVKAMQSIDFTEGDEPCQEGKAGDVLFIMRTGSADVIKNTEIVDKKEPSGDAVFGELELMYDHPCVATIRISTPTATAWKMDREVYKNLVLVSAIRKREMHMEHLKKVKFLATLPDGDLIQLADALQTDEWDEGDTIIKHGTEGEFMYLILEGEVEVIGRNEKGEQLEVCKFSEGKNFGELEFMNNHPCVADVKATKRTRTARINRRHFEMCLGPVMGVLKRTTDGSDYDYYRQQLQSPTTTAGTL
eukprot:TRINITY_DN20921_c0_g1_i1.p1 TRINITY_DN20921_c0_g1~~TRINITY_DN20921_c0_g1_i1.p1  ORF type:complete len:500 (+),score=94.72 TRINITY_DN20921_c0_g1_i1:119-1618(+)